MSTSPEQEGAPQSDGVAVVTDTTTYLPAELIERWAIRQVSLFVGWGGDLQR
jgi:fatty acid-binding protein DegV